MLRYYGNSHLYTALEIQRIALAPVNMMARMCKEASSHNFNPLAYTDLGRQMAAGCEMLERMTRHFAKPEFNIDNVEIDGQDYAVSEEYPIIKKFGRIVHFKKKKYTKKQEKLLIVAPLSGHYATLLRGTVEGLLPHMDVYITDWQNAQEIPMSEGTFDLDDCIGYITKFIHTVGENTHVMAVCQPAVPVMAAVSLMSTAKDKYTPKSMIMIGGPIDTRKSPTEVNRLAEEKPIDWFEHNVISRVPMNYIGAGRPVYPGFIQLSGFMTMNLERHIEAHKNLFDHLVEGDGDSADAHKDFYNEYLSVMDIPAEFYLQTVKTVFQEHSLPKGTLVSKGKPVRPQDITQTALMCIEGERDDISGVGQTKAAMDICSGIPKSKKLYHLQEGAGHYGIFNGKRYRKHIVPAICKFITKHSRANNANDDVVTSITKLAK